ncbi:thioredoxin [candidate division KSB1 bacterium 4484_87]|nr:MAG: thioredoxin [candidate division KSB1 bacterium 4484_87]
MSELLTITTENFEDEVLNSDVPVLIDFWAIWCAPCKLIAPIVEDMAKEYAGKLKVGKCDVDSNQAIALQYGIRSIPTVLIFKDGKVKEQIIGAVPKHHIADKVKSVLS